MQRSTKCAWRSCIEMGQVGGQCRPQGHAGFRTAPRLWLHPTAVCTHNPRPPSPAGRGRAQMPPRQSRLRTTAATAASCCRLPACEPAPAPSLPQQTASAGACPGGRAQTGWAPRAAAAAGGRLLRRGREGGERRELHRGCRHSCKEQTCAAGATAHHIDSHTPGLPCAQHLPGCLPTCPAVRVGIHKLDE